MATALEANPITKSIRGGAAVASTQLLQHAIVMQALNRHDVLHLSTPRGALPPRFVLQCGTSRCCRGTHHYFDVLRERVELWLGVRLLAD